MIEVPEPTNGNGQRRELEARLKNLTTGGEFTVDTGRGLPPLIAEATRHGAFDIAEKARKILQDPNAWEHEQLQEIS